jgi:hypothetical protein
MNACINQPFKKQGIGIKKTNSCYPGTGEEGKKEWDPSEDGSHGG